jgi:hypothetical protein
MSETEISALPTVQHMDRPGMAGTTDTHLDRQAGRFRRVRPAPGTRDAACCVH